MEKHRVATVKGWIPNGVAAKYVRENQSRKQFYSSSSQSWKATEWSVG